MSLSKTLTILFSASRQYVRSNRSFYDWRTRSETIFALATSIQPAKGSPLAIIRVSGPKTCHALQQLTQLTPERPDKSDDVNQQTPRKRLLSRYATLTEFLEPEVNEVIDVGLVLWFPKPNSYTGEDSCELHAHGSQAIVKKLMSTLGRLEGIRPAEPGEFTRRAVENGKISLIQAESIPELVASQTDQQRRLALRGLSGATRKKYDAWIEELVRVLAHLEASIDFGEDELIGEQKVVNECIQSLNKLSSEISRFVNVTSRCRDLANSGLRLSILGRPNAGKSTLMNMLCRQEKSIVSNLSGTTRDVIEHTFDLNGYSLTLSDTAGLRDMSGETSKGMPPLEMDVMQQHDSIEREGIRRALQSARKADLLLYIIDGDRLTAQDDQTLVNEMAISLGTVMNEAARTKVIHLVINKIDLNWNIEKFDLRSAEESLRVLLKAPGIHISAISCKTEENIDQLVKTISQSLDVLQAKLDGLTIDAHLEYANERHLALLGSALVHLDRASKQKMEHIDEMAQHVRESVDYLSRIVGSVSNEHVFDIIFRDFCIGK